MSNITKVTLKKLWITKLNVPNIPCHAQAVEKTIKLVTEASLYVEKKEREVFIQNKLKSLKTFLNLKQRKKILDIKVNS